MEETFTGTMLGAVWMKHVKRLSHEPLKLLTHN